MRHQFHAHADVSMLCLSREGLGPAAVLYTEDLPLRHLFHPRTDVSIPCLSREQLVPVAVLYTEDFPLRHQFHPRADVSMPCLSRERLGPAAVPYGEDFPLRPHSPTVTEYLLFIWVMGKHVYHVEGPMVELYPYSLKTQHWNTLQNVLRMSL